MKAHTRTHVHFVAVAVLSLLGIVVFTLLDLIPKTFFEVEKYMWLHFGSQLIGVFGFLYFRGYYFFSHAYALLGVLGTRDDIPPYAR